MKNKDEILEVFTRMGDQIEVEHAPDAILSAEIKELIFAIRQLLTLKMEWMLQPHKQEEIEIQITEVESFICERRGNIKRFLQNYSADQKAGIEDDLEMIVINANKVREEMGKHALQFSDAELNEWGSGVKPRRSRVIVLSDPIPGTTPLERKGKITSSDKPVNGHRTVHTPATGTPSKPVSTLQQGFEKMSQAAGQSARRSISKSKEGTTQ